MDEPKVLVKRTRSPGELLLPAYQTPHAAGLDLSADLDDDLTIAPLARALIPTGLALAIPEGFEGQVRPRSGLALKQGLTVLNAPGTIDADYRGEVKVLLVNLSNQSVNIHRGDRIAQLVISRVARATLEQVDALPQSHRAEGGFGSTGKGR